MAVTVIISQPIVCFIETKQLQGIITLFSVTCLIVSLIVSHVKFDTDNRLKHVQYYAILDVINQE